MSDSEIQYDSSLLFIYTVFYLYKKNVSYDIHSSIYIVQKRLYICCHSDIYMKFTEEHSMRRTKQNVTDSRKEMPYESNSLKDGNFTKDELSQYGLSDEEIAVILDYQALLPVLQEDDENLISARVLHSQLKVGRDFATWINQQIEENDLIKDVDYFISKGNSREINASSKYMNGKKPTIEYNLTLDSAKSISMVAGAKARNTNKELKEMSKLVRKYFIIVEKAFKNRVKWNHNRKNTLINCKELRGALIIHKQNLLNGVPEWMTISNLYIIEFSLLNSVILGMSATQYRKENNISDTDQIRNYFSDDQLDDVERLERYDAQLIISQEIFSYDERKQILQKEYNRVKDRKTKYV